MSTFPRVILLASVFLAGAGPRAGATPTADKVAQPGEVVLVRFICDRYDRCFENGDLDRRDERRHHEVDRRMAPADVDVGDDDED